MKVYPGAGHSFLNDAPNGPALLRPLVRIAGVGPEPTAAADAWGRIEAFFAAPPALSCDEPVELVRGVVGLDDVGRDAALVADLVAVVAGPLPDGGGLLAVGPGTPARRTVGAGAARAARRALAM